MPCGPGDWCLAIAPQPSPCHLPALGLPTCSTGKHWTFVNLYHLLTPNFSWRGLRDLTARFRPALHLTPLVVLLFA